MHKSEISLHYMYLRINGKDYRIMSTNFPHLEPGHETSDAFGYFGMGSGEFQSARIKDLFHDITIVEVKGDINTALLYWKDHPRFMGFVDRSPQQAPYVILRDGEDQLHDIDFNWEVYTQLGVPDFARDTIKTLSRNHVTYPTHDEQRARINEFIHYTYLF